MSLKDVLEKLVALDPEARRDALVTLARTRDARALPYLKQAADEDPDPEPRYLARKAIQYLSPGGPGPAPAPAPQAPPAPPHPTELAGQLESPDPQVRLRAAKACTQVKSTGMAELLSSRLKAEEHPAVVATLLAGVAAGGDESCVEAVVPWLRNDDPRIRANAIEALGALGSERGFVYLLAHLRDPDNRCRGNAVLALRKSGRANVHRTLETMLRSDSASMQDSATYCLGCMGQGPEIFALLQLAMQSGFAVIRNQARSVLRKLQERGSDRAGEVLRRFGPADESEAAEDLFARAKSTAGPAEAPREDREARADRLRGALEKLGGLAGTAVPLPAAVRAEAALRALGSLAAVPAAPAPSPAAPAADALADRLRALSRLGAEDLPGRPRRDEALAETLRGLGAVEARGPDPRRSREEKLLAALQGLGA